MSEAYTVLGRFGIELRKLYQEIETTTQQLATLKEEARRLECDVLPDLMAEAGVQEFKMQDGSALALKPYLSASIPSATAMARAKSPEELEELKYRRDIAYDWLRTNGAGDLIKNEVTAVFGKGQDKLATSILNLLRTQLDGVAPVTHDETVHPQTLLAYLRNRLKAGQPLPTEQLGIKTGMVVEFKAVKEK